MNDYAETERPEPPVVRHDLTEAGAADGSAFAVHRDPSLTTSGTYPRVGRGIAWVRPSDLIATSSARIAGRGIDMQTALTHRVRRAPGQVYRATKDRARDYGIRKTDRVADRVVSEPSPFDSFDVFEAHARPRSASWVRPSGIGLE